MLKFSLRHRAAMLFATLMVFMFSIFIMIFGLGKEFLPPEDQGNFIIRLEAPIDYSVEQVEKYFRPAEKMVRDIPEIKSGFYVQGYQGYANRGIMIVGLIPKADREKSQEDIKKIVRMNLKQIPGLKVSAEDVSLGGGGIRQVPIQYSIRGQDLNELQKYARQITTEFAKRPGIVDVDTSLEAGKPEFKVYIDRDKAADLGVDVATIAEAINLLVGGELDIASIRTRRRANAMISG